MANDNTKYLKFSAYSIKDAITRKLSEDSKFTDQVYEGSNLAIMIDIFSYIFQCLVWQLNNAASESMFADTQLYDNITRLVKFLGYQVRGCTPSTVNAVVSNRGGNSLRGYWIPPYSRIDTGKTDVSGRKIYFSTSCGDITTDSMIKVDDSQSKAITLYNGQWKLYDTVFTASGTDNETFTLTGLKSDTDDQKYVAHEFIDVYVMPANMDGENVYTRTDDGGTQYVEQWTMDKNGIFTGYESNGSQLFNNQTSFKSLYPGTYPIYTAYLNSDKTYEIKFGNGVVGKKLRPGDKVYVFYLDTNGPDGKIDTSDIDTSTLSFEHDASMFGLNQDAYNNIFRINPSDGAEGSKVDADKNLSLDGNRNIYQISFQTANTTTPQMEESVEDIRTNAPLWFTTGNRLVTRFDYEYYIKNARNSATIFGFDVIDAKCMNNWEYMTSFYKWLYTMGESGKLIQYSDKLPASRRVKSNPRRYINKGLFARNEYFYADSADANNLYIWLKSSNDDFDVQNATGRLNNILNPIKLMTAELVAVKAINVNFDICAAPEDYVLNNYLTTLFTQDSDFDSGCESYIEITLDDNQLYVANSLQRQVADIITQAFDVNKCRLGEAMRYDEMLNQIYEINGVQRVRTVFMPPEGSGLKPRAYDGLSFCSWTDPNSMIDLGDDVSVSNTVRHIEEFQYPVFYGKNTLASRIKVIKKTLTKVNTIKF